MVRTHTPLSVWFWAAYLVASKTPGMSATQFQRRQHSSSTTIRAILQRTRKKSSMKCPFNLG